MSSTTTDRIDGLSTSVAVKAPVKAVAVSNITLSGEQTVNGVAVVSGDRVLVTAQTSSVDNGIYDVSASSWTRSADFDGNRDVVKGTLVVSNTGTSIYYRVTSADPIVIGTSAIDFEVVAGAVSQASIGAALHPRTAAEVAAGVTPSDYSIPSHDSVGVVLVERYGFDKTNTTADQSSVLQAAYDVAVQCGGGVIEIPDSDFRAEITITHPGIVFRGAGGISSATIWRNVDATAPVTFDNSSRGIVGSGLERLKLQNQNTGTYPTTNGLVISSEATGANQMDYLSFKDVYILNFYDNIRVSGRAIWVEWDQVRSEGALRDAFNLVGSDNFSQHKFYLCRFGNAARHGFYADLDFAGLTSTGVSFDTCTFEQNEQCGVRITGDVGLSGWNFSACYFEENAGSLSAGSTAPRKAHVHVDSVYALGLRFESCVFYGNTAPDVDVDWAIYVDTAVCTNVHGAIDNCRVTDAVIGSVYWPKNVYIGINDFAGTSVWTPSQGSVSLTDQNVLLTCAPGLAFGGASAGMTYASQVGRYTVHGRLVTVTAYVALSAKGASTGAATLTGLPVTASNVTNLLTTGTVSADALAGALALPLTARIVPGTTTAALYKLSGGTLTALTESDFGDTTAVAVTISYFA